MKRISGAYFMTKDHVPQPRIYSIICLHVLRLLAAQITHISVMYHAGWFDGLLRLLLNDVVSLMKIYGVRLNGEIIMDR